MRNVFAILIFIMALNSYGQNTMYEISSIKDPDSVTFDKEKEITINSNIYDDFGNVLVKVYFLEEPFIKIKRLESKKDRISINYDEPIYGIIYSKLVEFFDKYVHVKRKDYVIYEMVYVFNYKVFNSDLPSLNICK
ncbi:MAG: hypothetical protein LBI73_09690 [Myroides sp.]|jgi:hypothetical protein|nr:hypothetical protein [Myroides sp.]